MNEISSATSSGPSGKQSWLLVVRSDGVIESVDGGAPISWITRSIAEIPELGTRVLDAFAALQASVPTLVRRSVVDITHGNDAVLLELLLVEALPLRRAHTRIADLMMRTLDAFVAQAKSSEVDLRVEQADGVPPVFFIDGEKIAWALATLLGNALRFAQLHKRAGAHASHVKVRLAWDEAVHELVISVQDDGPGMPEHRSRWLFERNPADGQSAGLALLMVRDVLIAHRGSIDVVSALGQGTTFNLRIPKPRA